MSMIFGSDNMVGASAQVLDAIIEANHGALASYGGDPWCLEAARRIAEVFECEAEVFFVASGTVANSLALSALVPPWGAVFGQADSHILNEESTAPELFTGGARMIGLPPSHGKLAPEALEQALSRPLHPPHRPVPGAFSLTQCNERGRVYGVAEVAALATVARRHGLKVHMDGARFANAVASLGCAPADITWRAGVDVLTLGASKNGGLMAEAVVFFDRELAADFAWRVKRAGQTAAKGRFFGAQFVGWLRDGHWLELARHANAMASRLAQGIAVAPGASLAWPCEANEVFALLPRERAEALWAAGAMFYEWPQPASEGDPVPAPDHLLARLVTSFLTEADEVDRFIQLLTTGPSASPAT
ncbi:MAG: low specificity L-threonine aldolase [Pigmentiphaga sp.]